MALSQFDLDLLSQQEDWAKRNGGTASIPGNETTQPLAATPGGLPASTSPGSLPGLITENGDFDPSALLNPSAYSTSKSNSLSTGGSNSSDASQSSGTTYSGLGPGARGAIEGAVLPGLTSSIGKLSGLPEQYANSANKLSESQARKAIEQLFPQVMESMSGKGMQNSSVASDSLSKGMAEIAKTFSDKGYQSKMDQAQMEMQIPQIMGQLAELAKYSQGENSSTSSGASTSKNNSESNSLTENKGEAYDRGLELLKTMLGL
jgi:hypothetical protein